MTVSDTSQAVASYRTKRLRTFNPPERLLVPEWAEKNIVLSERETDFPGSYRTSVAPYARGPMDVFTDNRFKTIVFVTCTQAGKTINVIVIPIAYTVDQDPGGCLLVQPTEPIARSFSESRLQPVFDQCEPVANLKPTDPDKYKLLSMQFLRSDVFLVGSNSPANLGSRPIRYIFADEIDKFPPASIREADALALALERVKAKFKAKIVLTSTPTMIDGNIWKWWTRSDQRHLLIACPKCGTLQKPIMGAREEYDYFSDIVAPPRGDRRDDLYRLKWPKDCAISDLDARAWYECSKCRYHIHDREMTAATNVATWKESAKSRRIAGFHLNAFGLPWIRMGEIAAEFLRAKRYPDELQNFYNSWLALPWDAVAQGTDTIDVQKIAPDDEADGYLVNTIPAGIAFLTVGIDVQAHEVFFVVRGWGAGGLSALITFGRVPVETDDVEDFVRVVLEIMSTDYGKPIILGGIDSGWGERTAEVYVISRAVPRLVCTKGRRSNVTKKTDGKDIPIPKPTKIDKMPDGTPLKSGPLLYSPSTSYWKRWVFSRINADPPRWIWPKGLKESKDGATYLRHLESEKEVTKKSPQTGRMETSWVVRRGFEANHWLDCEVIATVVQEIALTLAKSKKLSIEDVAGMLAKMTKKGSAGPRTPQARAPRKPQQHNL